MDAESENAVFLSQVKEALGCLWVRLYALLATVDFFEF